ncbi:MAG: PAS domain-containing protein [Thermodesulfobacteriota bacterium]|nr:PAS domain-containing protein [Thermodesulfobacteriota bacterium]
MEHLLERFRIVEELDSLVLCEDSRGRVVFVSPFALKFLGWHRNHVMGREIGRLFPGEPCFAGSPRGRTEIGNDSREVRWRSFACEHRRSDGARVWIAWKRKPFPGPSGDPDHFLWTGKDITALVQVQDALMAQETRYRLFFNSLNDASFVHQLGPDGTPGPFVEVNDAACRRYGYTRDELLRLTPADLAVAGAEESGIVPPHRPRRRRSPHPGGAPDPGRKTHGCGNQREALLLGRKTDDPFHREGHDGHPLPCASYSNAAFSRL